MALAPEIQGLFDHGNDNPGAVERRPVDAAQGEEEAPEEMDLQVEPEQVHDFFPILTVGCQ